MKIIDRPEAIGYSVASVPEPRTASLMILGMLLIGVRGLCRKV